MYSKVQYTAACCSILSVWYGRYKGVIDSWLFISESKPQKWIMYLFHFASKPSVRMAENIPNKKQRKL